MSRQWASRIRPFGIVGAIVTVADYSTFFLVLRMTCTSVIVSNFVGWTASLLIAYGLHSVFTFKIPPSIQSFIRFVAVAISTLAISTAVVAIAALFMPAYLAKAVATGVTFFAGYALSQKFAFPSA